jgi:acyl carrier protein
MSKVSEKEVLEVIRKALGIKEQLISYDSSAANLVQWDSLGHLGVLTALDVHFSGRIASIKEMAQADSVKKILQILKDNSLI